VWRWCVQAARGGYGAAGRLAMAVVAVVGLGLAARLAVTAVRMARAASARRRRHLQILTLAGRASPQLGATVIEHPRPAAYVLGGRGRPVVVSTGALHALTGPELAAVLAHERAHAAGRHDLLLDGVRLLENAFPTVSLFATARTELARLVELRADEVATAGHAPISLAGALVSMATAGSTTGAVSAPVPAGAVAATGGDAFERLTRLLSPPAPLSRAQRMAVAAAVTALALVPVVFVVAAQFVPLLSACPSPTS